MCEASAIDAESKVPFDEHNRFKELNLAVSPCSSNAPCFKIPHCEAKKLDILKRICEFLCL